MGCGFYDTHKADKFGKEAVQKSIAYAKENGLVYTSGSNKGKPNTFENQADAYRHYYLNVRMMRGGITRTDTSQIVTNHEIVNLVRGDYGSGKVVITVSAIMDLHNNRIARAMAANDYYDEFSIDEMFEEALSLGVVLTSQQETIDYYNITDIFRAT